MRLPYREKLPRPADIALCIGRIGLSGQDNGVVLQVAMKIRGFRLTNSAIGAVQLGKENGCKRRGTFRAYSTLASITSSVR